MSRISPIDFTPRPKRARIAGVVCAGAVALLALDAGLEWPAAPAPQPAPGVVRFAPAPESAGFKTLSYYPEQLAALSSLASFTPQASSGSVDASPESEGARAAVVSTPVTTRSDAKIPRRADQSVKAASAAPTAGAAESADRNVKWFGVAIPGSAAIGDRIAALRDGATKAAWGLGGGVATLWR